jgi:hypothetical protein
MEESKDHETWIKTLNQQANQYEANGMSAYDAIEQVASEMKLSVISEGDVCRVYQTPNGILVNCWVDQQPVEHAELPRPKFDNNIVWFTSEKK